MPNVSLLYSGLKRGALIKQRGNITNIQYNGEFAITSGIRTQLLPLNGRTRYGYTYTQNSSPIYWGVKLTNHVELLLLISVWLDCCLSFQEMLN